jgi:hypothetical protein
MRRKLARANETSVGARLVTRFQSGFDIASPTNTSIHAIPIPSTIEIAKL